MNDDEVINDPWHDTMTMAGCLHDSYHKIRKSKC